MEITIKGNPDKIAALILQLHGRQKKDMEEIYEYVVSRFQSEIYQGLAQKEG